MEKELFKVSEEEVDRNLSNVECKTVIVFGIPFTVVFVKMCNGFVISESTTCVDPKNYSEEIGKKVCLAKLRLKVWFLLGYSLQGKINESGRDRAEFYDKSSDED